MLLQKLETAKMWLSCYIDDFNAKFPPISVVEDIHEFLANIQI